MQLSSSESYELLDRLVLQAFLLWRARMPCICTGCGSENVVPTLLPDVFNDVDNLRARPALRLPLLKRSQLPSSASTASTMPLSLDE